MHEAADENSLAAFVWLCVEINDKGKSITEWYWVRLKLIW